MYRVTSPDGAVDAVIMADMAGGATVTSIYKVYVTPAGGSSTEGDRILSAEHPKGLVPRWRDERSLEIRYGEGTRISGFTNQERVTNEQGESFKVESRLVPLDEPGEGS